MIDHLELYVSPAKSISIDSNVSVNISSIEVNDRARHCHIASTQTSIDQYGDQIIKLSINSISSAGSPVQKLRLKSSCGEVGFDSVKIPREVIYSLLKHSYLATDKPEKLIPFQEFSDVDSIDLMQFFKNKGKLPFIITYHKPKQNLWHFFQKNQFDFANAFNNLHILINSLQHCDAAMLWSWAYGLNPSIFSIKSNIFISQLQTTLTANAVQMHFLLDESQLPEW